MLRALRARLGLVPLARVGGGTSSLLVLFWGTVLVLAWTASPFRTLPTPREVFAALGDLWLHRGLGPALGTTLSLTLEATFWTVVVSMPLAYGAVVPALRPVVGGVSKLRFVGLVGVVFPFTLMTGGGHALKVALLTFGMATFFVTQIAREVATIEARTIDHLRVLGASELRVFWEAVVRGTLAPALETLRQNVAMGWSMITMVEGISRAEGGIGAMLLDENRHFRLAHVYAVILLVLLVGLLLDAVLGVIARWICPYAEIERVKS